MSRDLRPTVTYYVSYNCKPGLDLLVNLRSDPRWSDIPLVVVTGSDKILEDDCQSYMGSHHGVRGPDGVLAKPVDGKTLLAVLRILPNTAADTSY